MDELPEPDEALSVSKSAVSRRWVALSQAQLHEWLSGSLEQLDLPVVMIDGIHFRDRVSLVALGIDAQSSKHVLGRARVERGEVAWCAPEILRARGEQARRQRTPEGNAAAELWLSRSLMMARDQGALSWELRAAMSMARLRRDQGRAVEAAIALKTYYGRFSEGLGTADLRSALTLLAREGEFG